MNCSEITRFIYVYFDGEFDPRECAEFEQHLADCESCRAMIPFEQSFHALLKSRLEHHEAPPRLRDGIIKALDREDETSAHRMLRLLPLTGSPRWGPLTRRRAHGLLLLPGLAAAVLLTVILWPGAAPHEQPTPALAETGQEAPPPVVSQGVRDPLEELLASAIEAHEFGAPVQLLGDQEAVQQFVRTQAALGAAPPFPVNETTRLIGARLTQVGNRPAVLYTYEHNGRRVSALQLPEESPQRRSPLNRAYYTGRTRGYNVAVFRDHERGLSHSIVGDLDEQDLLHLIRPASY